MSYHYKKDGTLDMRYSSSRQAASSGYSGGGGGSARSSYSSGRSFSGSSYQPSSSSSGHHYKKDGSLDMRYSSSRQAMATCYETSGYGSSSSSFDSPSSDLHYKKDGTLDMRYSSSKQEAASSYGGGSSSYNSGRSSSGCSNQQSHSSSEHHYKKDGTLDMRYASSKSAMSSGYSGRSVDTTSSQTIHYKKDGTPDLRFKTSKALADVSSAMKKVSIGRPTGIPAHVPLTKLGLPDMRTSAAKEWVASQASGFGGAIPSWIPTRKDGSVDTAKAVGMEFMKQLGSSGSIPAYRPDRRLKYYEEKMDSDDVFSTLVDSIRRQEYIMPQPPSYNPPYELSRFSSSQINHSSVDRVASEILSQIRDSSIQNWDMNVKEIKFSELDLTPEAILGRGAFGVVKKGKWMGRNVAVKELHLQQLSKKDKLSFLTEVKILTALSGHRNLVKLHGYTMAPWCLVLEFVELGSLSQLLHHNEDPIIEANITDGRVKKGLALGIAYGMVYLHQANVVHGDLKPQNVLVTGKYEAKIADFGLATIRGKTSTTVNSSVTHNEDNAVGGTAGYMAPELLDSSGAPELSSDVYCFGVVLNEIIHEEEPYADQYQKFAGRGPFAAANHAKLGYRPRIDSKVPGNVQELIKQCWSAEPRRRPTFKEAVDVMKKDDFKIPNFVF